jgi:hypothetical protein
MKGPYWTCISECNIDASQNLFLGGDFNHLVETNKAFKKCNRFLRKREVVTWHNPILQYGLVNIWGLDKYYKMLEKSYTFNNGKVGPHLVVSTHIDKFMVLVELDAKGGKIETKTLVK